MKTKSKGSPKTGGMKQGHQGGQKVGGVEVHAAMTDHAARIMKKGGAGGNHLVGVPDDFNQVGVR